MGCFVELPICPADRSPVVDRCGYYATEGRRDYFEIGEGRHGVIDHCLETVRFEIRQRLVDSFDFVAQARGEIFFIADHNVDVLCDFTVYLLSFFDAADILPEGRAVIEVVGYDRASVFAALAASITKSAVVSLSAA